MQTEQIHRRYETHVQVLYTLPEKRAKSPKQTVWAFSRRKQFAIEWEEGLAGWIYKKGKQYDPEK